MIKKNKKKFASITDTMGPVNSETLVNTPMIWVK